MRSLTHSFPQVTAARIIDEFRPPRRFAQVSFDNYVPSPSEPSQHDALVACRNFLSPPKKKSFFHRSSVTFDPKPGLYLDGGFGVGKTHLLASMWHHANSLNPGKSAYASFVEVTNAVGALGFQETVEELSRFTLICIDEFELDDPGDTVLMSSLLHALVDKGVRFAVTSNTLPDRLGEGRFAADDFIREIQGLRAHFDVVRIDGPDFRRVSAPEDTTHAPLSHSELSQVKNDLLNRVIACDSFVDLNAHLVKVHPSAYGELVSNLEALLISEVAALENQAHALRWVAFIDKVYDREVPVRYSGTPWRQFFSPEMIKGGYRKKYLRALSRIESLVQLDI